MPHDARRLDPDELLAHAGWLRALARSLVRDAHLAEDVAQQTMTAAIEHPPRGGVPLRAWLARVARNVSLNAVRSRGRRERHERAASSSGSPGDGPPAPPSSPEDAAARAEMMHVAFEAVLALDAPLRDVVLARFFDDLGWDATAHRLGVPVETARTRLKRALAVLRERLDRKFGSRAAWTLVLGSWDRAAPTPCPVRPPVATPVGVAASAAGGTVMGLAVNSAVAVAAALLVGAVGWWAANDDAPAADPRVAAGDPPTTAVAATRPAGRARAGAPHAADAPTRPVPDDLPPAVDLDRCDRDLDLFGRVIDEAGDAVPGAEVAAAANPWSRLGVWRDRDEYVAGPSTRTARDGTFALRLSRGACVDLRVGANGFGELVRENCLAGERATVVLPRGSALVVTVVDEADRPVEGVDVRVWRAHGGAQQFVPVRQQFDVRTSADGMARFSGLLAGSLDVRVRHSVLGDPGWESVEVPATRELRIVLPAGRTVRGRVADTDGRPVPGARVGANSTLDRAVVADADGHYEFLGWTGRGTSILLADAPGFLSRWKKVPDSGDLDFVLEAGARATGRVTGASGLPVTGALVVARSVAPDNSSAVARSVQADADGRFALDGLAPGRVHSLVVAAHGLGRAVLDFDAPSAAAGPLELGEVRVGTPRAIEGLVTDGDGAPLPDVSVTLVGANDDRGRGRDSAGAVTVGKAVTVSESRRTDDLGRFRFPDVAPGSYRVAPFLTDAPRIGGTRVVVPPDRDCLDVRVALPGSRRLVVRVVDEQGSPLPGMSVQVDGPFGTEASGARHPVMLHTDAAGLAVARGLPAAETRVFVSPFGQSEFMYESVPPFVPDGSEVRVVLRRSVEVRGLLRDAAGLPVPRLYVEARFGGDRPGSQSATADEEGRFAVKVPSGTVVTLEVKGLQLQATKEKSQLRSTPWRGTLAGVRAPADGLVLVVTRETAAGDRTLTVVVLDSTGAPMPDASVAAYGEPGRSPGNGTTDARGSVTLDGLPGGPVRVHVDRPRSRDDLLPRLEFPPAPRSVPASEQVTTLRFRAAVAIRGRVLDADGKPIAGIPVNVTTPDGVRATVRSDADGGFVAPGLPGEAHRLECSRWRSESDVLRATVEGIVPDAATGPAGVVLRVMPPPK